MRDSVIIVGSGMMGSGIGAMSALAGNKTILTDVDPVRAEAGRTKAIECIRLRVQYGLHTPEEGERAVDLLETADHLEDAAKKARLVIEAVVENLEIKQNLFRRLDAILPESVPICSNTSGLRITDISKTCRHPQRTLTTHFWLPAHLVPLVEVVMGGQTEETIAAAVRDELKMWQKAPVLVKKDLPGQLANRIFQAIIREAVDIVETGLASAEDVDDAISYGMAMRFPAWGPLKHLDAIGLDLGLSVQETVLPGLNAGRQAGEYLKGLVADGNLGVKTGKGFYDWSERDIAEDTERRDRFIVEAVKAVNEWQR